MAESLKTVLVFAHECAPYNRPESTVGAQRPAQFAKYLPEFGWRAIVLCCDHDRSGEARRGDLGGVAREARDRLLAADPNASVIIPTPSLPWDGPVDRMWTATTANGRRGRLAGAIRKPLTAMRLFLGDYSRPWRPCARAAAAELARTERIDVCLAEHSPDAGVHLARWYSSTYGTPWVGDFRDPVLWPLRPMPRLLYRPVARHLLASASATVAVNREWARLDQELFGLPAWSIPNGFDPDEFPTVERSRNDRFTVVYAGNFFKAQRIEIFLEGLARARGHVDEQLFRKLAFVYRGHAHEAVHCAASQAGVSDIVEVSPPIDRVKSLVDVARADALLLLSIADPAGEDYHIAKGFYPAKVFEYFGARRPILCVPGDRGMLDELIVETKTGVVLATPEAVALFLADALREWAHGRDLPYEPDEGAVGRYTRRNLSNELAVILDSVAVGHATEQAWQP